MKLKFISILFTLLSMLFIVATVGANGKGHTASQLENAGWTCFNTGPRNWVHCLKKDPATGPNTVLVKVFSEDGDEFLGTESLVRADLYNGQPCPQENLDEYEGLDFNEDGMIDYYACHHFPTPG